MGDPEFDRLDNFIEEHRQITAEYRASNKRSFGKLGKKIDSLESKQQVAAIELNTVQTQLKLLDPQAMKDEITGIVDLKLELVQAKTDTVRANAEIERLNSIKKVSIDWVKIIRVTAAVIIATGGILGCIGLM